MCTLLEKELEHEFQWSQNERYKNKLGEWMNDQEFDYFVTLTFKNEEITRLAAENTLRIFCMKLNRKLFGNHSKERMVMAPFIEKNSYQGWHFHIFIKLPTEEEMETIREHMKRIWCSLKESGSSTFYEMNDDGSFKWFTPIYDSKSLSKYVLKQSNNSENSNLVSDQVYLK
jgi:hypothetical protein